MTEFISKLSSYNIFNYLLPGVLYVGIVSNVTAYDLIYENILIGLFIYYFIGLVISRLGSLCIEPLLRKVRFVVFAPYKDFVIVAAQDPKLDELSESNNMYRTMIALFIVVLLTCLYEVIEIKLPEITNYRNIFLIVGFLVLFLFSYRKQTSFIRKRVETKRTS